MTEQPARLTRPSLTWRIVGLAALAILVVQIARVQIGAALLQTGNAGAALAMASFDTDVRAHVAADLLEAGHVPEAIAQAHVALRTSPINQPALRTLGQALEKTGHAEDAATAMTLAGRLGWRDSPTSLWLMQHLALTGRFEDALHQADALARREKASDAIYPVFYAAMEEVETRSHLADLLAARPPWRGAFFAGSGKLPPRQFDGFERLLEQLARRRSTATREEVMPHVDQLVASAQTDRGRTVWLMWGGVGRPPLPVPYDGDFTTVALNDRIDRAVAPFEWSVAPNAQDRVSAGGNGADRGLEIAPATETDEAPIVSQVLTLAPGRHAILFSLVVGEPSNVAWTLACRPGSVLIVVPLQPSDRGGMVRGAFTVPATACSAQTLTLRARGQTDPVRVRGVRIIPL